METGQHEKNTTMNLKQSLTSMAFFAAAEIQNVCNIFSNWT
jgi:hypothetical protein